MGIWNLFFFCKSVLHRPGCLPLWHTRQLRWKVALRSRPSVVASAERSESLFLTCFKAFRISRYSRMLLYSFSGAVQSDVDVLFLCIKNILGLCIHDSSVCGVLDHVGPHSSRLDVHVPNLQWSNSPVLLHQNIKHVPFSPLVKSPPEVCLWIWSKWISRTFPAWALAVGLGAGFFTGGRVTFEGSNSIWVCLKTKLTVLMGTLMLPSFW